MNITNIHNMEISGYTFVELPSKSFDGLNIKFLRLKNNKNFKTIKKDSFSDICLRAHYDRSNRDYCWAECFRAPSKYHTNDSFKWHDHRFGSAVEFPNLITLSLRELTTLNPNWFLKLPGLKTLNLEDNPTKSEYSQFAEFFISNPLLESVVLTKCSIIDLVPVLNWLKSVKSQLKSLILDENKIKIIPDDINSFTQLTYLKIRNNSIESISSETFRGLNELVPNRKQNNQISSITRDGGYYGITRDRHNSKLEKLWCSYNKFNHSWFTLVDELSHCSKSKRSSNRAKRLSIRC